MSTEFEKAMVKGFVIPTTNTAIGNNIIKWQEKEERRLSGGTKVRKKRRGSRKEPTFGNQMAMAIRQVGLA